MPPATPHRAAPAASGYPGGQSADVHSLWRPGSSAPRRRLREPAEREDAGSVGYGELMERGRAVRITGTGHASMRIDTGAGSILCDPWVNPAYFASWFPFPDNSQLDWERSGDVDYLYVCHLHRDHFDAAHLQRFVSKKATVLLPEYPTSELEDELRELGFTPFLETVDQRGVRARRRAEDHDPGADLARPTGRSATRRCGWSTTASGCSTRTTPAPPT